jgi:Rieske Fe-S protein
MFEAVAETRRDFLYLATAGFAAAGAVAGLVPLIAHVNPDASTIAMAVCRFRREQARARQQAMVFLAQPADLHHQPPRVRARDLEG